MDPKEIDAQIAALKAEIANLQVLKSKASSSPEGEMTMKEMLEKLGDPRSEMVSDDPVSKADSKKKIPSVTEVEDRKALDASLDRAMAKAGVENPAPDIPPEPDVTLPDLEGMLEGIKEDAETFDDAPVEDPDTAVGGVAEVVDDPQAIELFNTVHGKFDPASSVDKKKLAQIKENMAKDEYKGLSPNQFALKMYREAA